jgi:hypothetical protein
MRTIFKLTSQNASWWNVQYMLKKKSVLWIFSLCFLRGQYKFAKKKVSPMEKTLCFHSDQFENSLHYLKVLINISNRMTSCAIFVVSVKFSLYFNWAPPHEGVLGEWRYSSAHSLTSAVDGGEWSASRPGRFTPRERAPGTHWIGGWVVVSVLSSIWTDVLQILYAFIYAVNVCPPIKLLILWATLFANRLMCLKSCCFSRWSISGVFHEYYFTKSSSVNGLDHFSVICHRAQLA